MPLREPEKRYRETTVYRRIVAADAPMVRWKVKMGDAEACSKPPFIDLVLPLVDVLRSTVFVLEPMVKPAADNGSPIWQNHHRAGTER
jgi:hypothetical protein